MYRYLLFFRKTVDKVISRKDARRQTFLLTKQDWAWELTATRLLSCGWAAVECQAPGSNPRNHRVIQCIYDNISFFFCLYLRLGACLYMRVKMCSPYKADYQFTRLVSQITVLQLFSYNYELRNFCSFCLKRDNDSYKNWKQLLLNGLSE